MICENWKSNNSIEWTNLRALAALALRLAARLDR